MSRPDVDGRKEEDPFWEIALSYDGRGRIVGELGDDHDCITLYDSDGNDEDGDHSLSGKAKKYHLPNSSVSLELAPLASDDGVWSPVGDHAWYSSALLTCLILRGTVKLNEEDHVDGSSDRSDGKRRILDGVRVDTERFQNEAASGIRVLELGSGAIGLPGISFAVALSQQPELFPSWTVCLTDNDRSLLKQLEANVESNILSKNILLSSGENGTESFGNKHIKVEYLDWDLSHDDDLNESEKMICNQQEELLSADVVVGSELVYTRETALALVKILLALLDRNPTVTIWIVQVTDRYGWSEIVIPALEREERINIESIPLTYEMHEVASTMIPMGGALDRYAFGAFRISNALRL